MPPELCRFSITARRTGHRCSSACVGGARHGAEQAARGACVPPVRLDRFDRATAKRPLWPICAPALTLRALERSCPRSVRRPCAAVGSCTGRHGHAFSAAVPSGIRMRLAGELDRPCANDQGRVPDGASGLTPRTQGTSPLFLSSHLNGYDNRCGWCG